MNHSTPASEDHCQREMPNAKVGCYLKSNHSQRHGKYAKSVHANINVDSNTQYDAFENVYVPEDFY